MRIVIVGGGIVGCSTAYYLCEKRKWIVEEMKKKTEQDEIVVIDSVGIAGAASGRAGGFLARDWHEGATAKLAKRSFDLHKELAERFGASKIGYRSVCALQPTCPAVGGAVGSKRWYRCEGEEEPPLIASRERAAQVIPERLVKQMFDASDAKLIVGHVVGLSREKDDRLSVEYSTPSSSVKSTLLADAVLFACGPWTGDVTKRCGYEMKDVVKGQKAASILLKPRAKAASLDDSMLFVDWRGDRRAGELELYPRLDGLYVCGCGSSPGPVNELPAEVTIATTSKDILLRCAAEVCPEHFSAVEKSQILRATACYLPVTRRGIVAGALDRHVFVATGHSCWGILNGPATGSGMAGMILSSLYPRTDAFSKDHDVSLLKPFSC